MHVHVIEDGICAGLVGCGESCDDVLVSRPADGYGDYVVVVRAAGLSPLYLPVDPGDLCSYDTGVALGTLFAGALAREHGGSCPVVSLESTR